MCLYPRFCPPVHAYVHGDLNSSVSRVWKIKRIRYVRQRYVGIAVLVPVLCTDPLIKFEICSFGLKMKHDLHNDGQLGPLSAVSAPYDTDSIEIGGISSFVFIWK